MYRIAARLGLIDPDRDKYRGPGSPGHENIQEAARQLFPHDPSLMDEPVWMMGRQPRNKGFCYNANPACDNGCLFAKFCPKSFLDRDPSAIGYSTGSRMPTPKLLDMHCPGPPTRTAAETTVQPKRVPGWLVIVSCVKNKIWDDDSSAPVLSPGGAAYVSSYFSKNRSYARTFGESWCVLSAKFGLVLPEEEIENYNVTFKHRSRKRAPPFSPPDLA